MKNKELHNIRADLYELREKFSELEFKVDHPPKFKKGDKVMWLKYMIKIKGIISSGKIEQTNAYNGWRSYRWRYTVIVNCNEIHKITQEGLELDDTPSK